MNSTSRNTSFENFNLFNMWLVVVLGWMFEINVRTIPVVMVNGSVVDTMRFTLMRNVIRCWIRLGRAIAVVLDLCTGRSWLNVSVYLHLVSVFDAPYIRLLMLNR